MLTDAQKSSVRRHLGYETIGLVSAIDGTRIFEPGFDNGAYLVKLEKKLENLPPVGEATLTGNCYGVVGLVGMVEPNTGNQLSVTVNSSAISGGSETLTVTATDGDTRASIAEKLVQAAAGNADLINAKIKVLAPYLHSGNMQIKPQISLFSAQPFTLTVTWTGTLAAVVLQDGGNIGPFLPIGAQNGSVTYIYGLLPILDYLESAHGGATRNLDTARADVWVARSDEIDQRQKLYRQWLVKLSNFMGVPICQNGGNRPAGFGMMI